jgi:hypothetical protein
MGCGGRGSVGAKRRSQGGLWLVSGFAGAQTNGADAYGEVVWSCNPVLFSSAKEPIKRRETKGFGDIG